jgi:hypothetical protein
VILRVSDLRESHEHRSTTVNRHHKAPLQRVTSRIDVTSDRTVEAGFCRPNRIVLRSAWLRLLTTRTTTTARKKVGSSVGSGRAARSRVRSTSSEGTAARQARSADGASGSSEQLRRNNAKTSPKAGHHQAPRTRSCRQRRKPTWCRNPRLCPRRSGMRIPDHDTRPEFEKPKVRWNPVISPGGLLVYSGKLWPQWTGRPVH